MGTLSIKEELKHVRDNLSVLKGLFKQSMEMADKANLKSKCEWAVEGVKLYIEKLDKVISSIDKEATTVSILQSLTDMNTAMESEKRIREKCGKMFSSDSALYSVYMGSAFGIGEAAAKLKPLRDKICSLLIAETSEVAI